MRILGIDPGVATVGIGIVESSSAFQVTPVEWMAITTPAGLPLPQRLEEIERDLLQILEDTQPKLAVIEKLFFKTNVSTAIDVAQARGVLLLTVARRGIPVMEPTPMQLKSAIAGDGSADKLQMQTMLLRLLRLTELPRPDDAADALALATYGALHHADMAAAR